ncbi:MAG: hypothetical protein HY200_04850 [Nitrospirae bacterium]|nr:hypothetical protein [Nitrospirota bacterium]MBI3594266.1 hypothetical protein [Nitrospirota bacterium]
MKTLSHISTTRVQILMITLLLISYQIAYSGEWEPIVPGIVGNAIEIRIKNLEFTNKGTPQIMNNQIMIIPSGIQMRWINDDPLVTVNGEQGLMPHGIKIADSSDKVFTASPILTKEQNVFSYTFNKEGTYYYSCFIHSFMTGKIIVIDLHGKNVSTHP